MGAPASRALDRPGDSGDGLVNRGTAACIPRIQGTYFFQELRIGQTYLSLALLMTDCFHEKTNADLPPSLRCLFQPARTGRKKFVAR